MNAKALKRLTRWVPVNHCGWFDLLRHSKFFRTWFDSADDADFGYACWLISQREIIINRGEEVAAMVKEQLAAVANNPKREKREKQLLNVFNIDDFHANQNLFLLFLELVSEGRFDHGYDHLWLRLRNLPKRNPKAALDLLNTLFDHYLPLRTSRTERPDARSEAALRAIRLPDGFVAELAQGAADDLVRTMLPKVISLIRDHEIHQEDGRVSDEIWPWLILGVQHDFKWSFLDGIKEAMGILAKNAPNKLDEYILGLENLPHQNVCFLLLSAWSENGAVFADRIVAYLLADGRRLDLGYGMWASGNGTAAISRRAISAASAHANEDHLRQLEMSIMAFYPTVEREDPKRMGYTQLLLLRAIDPARSGTDVKSRLEELNAKFSGVDLTSPSASGRSYGVRSPIPDETVKTMTDDEWAAAMHEYTDTSFQPARARRLDGNAIVGGALEVSQQLQREAAENKERFAALAVKLGAEVPVVYFEALLRAFVAKQVDQQSSVGRSGTVLPELKSGLLFPVFRHIHRLPKHPCGRWLCSAIGAVANRPIPDDILKIVCYYAKRGGDPTSAGEPETARFGGDLVNYGINTTRGAAADALANLLFSDKGRWKRIAVAVLAVTNDQAWSVRSVAVTCLTALLNVDRSLAVKLFLETVRAAPVVLGSLFVGRFLYHAIFSHYTELRTLLLEMLSNRSAEAQESASQAICIASFRNQQANNDVEAVKGGDVNCRTAMATIAAGNLKFPEVAGKCREWLIPAFRDESDKVRAAAAQFFQEISDDQLCLESQLIDAFLNSPAFEGHAHTLIFALENAVHRLPDVVLKIPEKAIEIHQRENQDEVTASQWWTHEMANLVLRLYEQTRDPKIKSRCLDAMDKMIEFDFGNITGELSKLERG